MPLAILIGLRICSTPSVSTPFPNEAPPMDLTFGFGCFLNCRPRKRAARFSNGDGPAGGWRARLLRRFCWLRFLPECYFSTAGSLLRSQPMPVNASFGW